MTAKTNKVEQWMPFYIADYLADTTRLTTEQHGAYFLLILDYWRNGPPPDRDGTLAQIAKLTPAKWRAMRPELAEKFQIKNGRWFHKRVERELGKAREMQTALSERGKAGAAARWGNEGSDYDASANSQSNATGNATGIQQAMAQGMPDTMLADAPSPSPTPDSLPSPAPTHSPPPQAASARGAMSKALRNRGVTGVTPSTPELDAWITAGVSIDLVMEAVMLARDKKPEPEPIRFGYLVPIVEQLTTPKQRVNGHAGKPWFMTWSNIVSKGAEKGLKESDYDSPPEFKTAVLKAHGITAEKVRQAEKEWV